MKANRMTCKQARPQIALWAGNDLDERSRHALERHLSRCPGCRAFRDSLQQAVEVLGRASQETELSPQEASLWPAVSRRIHPLQGEQPPERASAWRPLLVIVAVCLAVAFISIRYPGTQYEVPGPVQPMQFAPAADQPSPNPVLPLHEEPVIVVEPQRNQAYYGWPFPSGRKDGRSLPDSRSPVPVVPTNEW